MARLGVQVNLANRIKRINNYTELYLCKKIFSYVCYSFRIIGWMQLFSWRKKYFECEVRHEKEKWKVYLSVDVETITISDSSARKTVSCIDGKIDFTEKLHKLYRQLDFTTFYYCAVEEVYMSYQD
jgi:hypothetical protein